MKRTSGALDGMILAMIVFTPSLAMMLTSGSSLAAGLLFSVLPLIGIAFFGVLWQPEMHRMPAWTLLFFLLMILFISLHLLVASFMVTQPQEIPRFVSGLVGLIVLCLGAFVLATRWVRLGDANVHRLLVLIACLLLINALVALTGIDFFGHATHKPVFLFSEPSHYALASAPFFLYFVKARARGWQLVLIFLVFWSMFIQNMTIVIVLLLAIGISFRIKVGLWLLPILLTVFLAFGNVNYFASRLVFSANEANLSGLVFMQGWENAMLTFADTHGWGAGFQQFGVASSSGLLTKQIGLLVSGTANLFDGGTTASKLIGEFGIFGVVLVLLIVVRAVRAFWTLKRREGPTGLELFIHCTSVAFVVELFVRGVGYFSPGIIILLTTYFCATILRTRHRETP